MNTSERMKKYTNRSGIPKTNFAGSGDGKRINCDGEMDLDREISKLKVPPRLFIGFAIERNQLEFFLQVSSRLLKVETPRFEKLTGSGSGIKCIRVGLCNLNNIWVKIRVS